MSHKTIIYEKKDNLVVIEIVTYTNRQQGIVRPYYQFIELCAKIAWDEKIKVVIIADGQEKSFHVGIDQIGTFSMGTGEQMNSCCLAEHIAKIDQPVVVAIKKDAVGQGLELALACDIRIASETSRFGLPQIKSGLIPSDGGTQRLSRLVGKGKALEMILTGEIIDAKEAFRIGLVNKIVSSDKLMAVAMDMAKEMASKGPIALKYTKEAIYKGMDMTLEQGLHLEADLYLLIHTTKDRTEGIKAFQEKRTPKFEGK